MDQYPKVPSLMRRIVVSALIGLIIAMTGSALEAIIDRHSVLSIESLDDILVGVVAAVIVFAYEQRRYRTVMEKVRIIALMNHHVRNALQAISYVPFAEHEHQIQMIHDSVARIQWALQEILPGEQEPHENHANAAASTFHEGD